jgi:hypothetical protein
MVQKTTNLKVVEDDIKKIPQKLVHYRLGK